MVDASKSITAHDILPICDGLEMSGLNTEAYSAEMIDGARPLAGAQIVRESVSVDSASAVPSHAISIHPATTMPKPAGLGLLDPSPKRCLALLRRVERASHTVQYIKNGGVQ